MGGSGTVLGGVALERLSNSLRHQQDAVEGGCFRQRHHGLYPDFLNWIEEQGGEAFFIHFLSDHPQRPRGSSADFARFVGKAWEEGLDALLRLHPSKGIQRSLAHSLRGVSQLGLN